MTPLKTIGIYLLFFSLPFIAVLKGKGIVLSLILAFFLLKGFDALKQFFLNKEWKRKDYKNFWILILLVVFLFFSILMRGEKHDLLHFLRVASLIGIAIFTVKGISLLSLDDRKMIERLFFQSYLIYIFFFLVELYGGSWISTLFLGARGYKYSHFIRGTVILTFFFLPFSWLLKKYYSRPLSILLLSISSLILALLLVKAQPSAARLAVLISGLFFIAGYFYKKIGFLILGIVSLYIIVAPLLFIQSINRQALFDVMHYLPPSYQHRVEIWHETAKHILEKPLLGHGFNYASKLKDSPHRCAHYAGSKFQKTILTKSKRILSKTPHAWGGVICYKDTLLFTHPHNSALQIWLEFGFLGVCMACYLLYKLTLYTSFQSSLYRGYLYSLFGLCLVYWNVSFGLWQNWMIALAALTFILFQLINGLPSKKKEDIQCTN
jgi:O-antigen ligase